MKKVTNKHSYFKDWWARKMQDPEFVQRERERNRNRLRDHGKSNYQHSKRWIAKNRLKARAHWKAKRAVKTGRLVKPEACEACGSKTELMKHHPKYDQPLWVIWLCRKCHTTHHRKPSCVLPTNTTCQPL